jgi:hypothetical protein
MQEAAVAEAMRAQVVTEAMMSMAAVSWDGAKALKRARSVTPAHPERAAAQALLSQTLLSTIFRALMKL